MELLPLCLHALLTDGHFISWIYFFFLGNAEKISSLPCKPCLRAATLIWPQHIYIWDWLLHGNWSPETTTLPFVHYSIPQVGGNIARDVANMSQPSTVFATLYIQHMILLETCVDLQTSKHITLASVQLQTKSLQIVLSIFYRSLKPFRVTLYSTVVTIWIAFLNV